MLTSIAIAVMMVGPKVDDLAFMAGHWASEGTEEVWLAPKDGLMVGMNRSTSANRKPFYEFLRIEEVDGKISYVAMPKGATSPTVFPVKEVVGQSVTFENLGHDFPQRIIYARKGKQLEGTVEGMVKGKMRRESWTWTLRP